MKKVYAKDDDRTRLLRNYKNYSISIKEQENSYEDIIGKLWLLIFSIDRAIKRKQEIAEFKVKRDEKYKKEKLKEIQLYQLKQIARKKVK